MSCWKELGACRVLTISLVWPQPSVGPCLPLQWEQGREGREVWVERDGWVAPLASSPLPQVAPSSGRSAAPGAAPLPPPPAFCRAARWLFGSCGPRRSHSGRAVSPKSASPASAAPASLRLRASSRLLGLSLHSPHSSPLTALPSASSSPPLPLPLASTSSSPHRRVSLLECLSWFLRVSLELFEMTVVTDSRPLEVSPSLSRLLGRWGEGGEGGEVRWGEVST